MNPGRVALILKARSPGMEGRGATLREQGPSACASEGAQSLD